MLRFLPIAIFLLVCTGVFTACDDDTAKTQASILGRWELVRAFRNKAETGTLAGVFFYFDADGKMTTNLPVGADVPTEYELKKNGIYQKSPQEVVYNILSVSDSALVLAMEMRGMQFELQLRRATESTPVEEMPVEGDTLQSDTDSISQ